jgi:hypothetical protein
MRAASPCISYAKTGIKTNTRIVTTLRKYTIMMTDATTDATTDVMIGVMTTTTTTIESIRFELKCSEHK